MLRGRHGNVDLEIGTANKGLCNIAPARDGLADLRHHHIASRRGSMAGNKWQTARLGVFQKAFQPLNALCAGALQVNLAGLQRGEHHHFIAGTRHRHVQATLTAGIVKRAEVHRHLPVLVRAIAYREKDDVALIALHILQVLHEDGLAAVHSQLLELRLFVERLHQVVLYQVALHLAESHDAYAVLP